ncbi:uncharacterized protein LOC130808483 [Amaranthus tricolor]|uniref:uncharacterized protein LOC130808483 n=1 Tax=Amaranthus tricolor TaxID=29722 RepID=UPI0025853318|nr:uncharacterized protein LOC130808483 [Amaranthus tricolor]
MEMEIALTDGNRDGNDQDDQYGEDGGNSVHHVDASLYTQPSFQDLLSYFGTPSSFTQLVQPSQQHPNDEAPIPSKKSWDLIEDIALICAVMNTSTDPIVSTNQKIRVRWQKVKEAYEEARMERPHLIPRRTADMLKCRWGRVAPACLKWSGSYNEALRRKKSGTRDEDVLKVVHLIHQKKCGNFNLIDSESSGKRSRTEEDSETPRSEPQGGSSTCPEGVKKAKARMTGKMVANQSIQALSAFGESLRLNSEIMKGKTELQKQKEARKQKQLQMEEYRMNWDIYQTLSKKENLQPWETDMMVQLVQCFQNYNCH